MRSMPNYEQYQSQVAADVAKTIKEKSCQPILFVGSGFSKRYCGAPNWAALLSELKGYCPEIKHDVPYYVQSKTTLPEVGSIYAKDFKEWAWGEGRKFFPPKYYTADVHEDIFIKHAISKRLEGLGPNKDGSFGLQALDDEIKALKAINPHAVITTNYDTLLEPIFPEYKPIIGQQVIRHAYMSIGEIFKIHGCVSEASSLVLTHEDYVRFANDKKYLSAKLFTYFVEHPLLFIGYAAGDPNIKAILQEIDHMLPDGGKLIENIYLLEWDENITVGSYPAYDKVIDLDDGKTARIKSITANSFEWAFNAFKSEAPLEKVNVKLLRSISHRVVDLVRKDAAKNVVEINFEMLNHALEHPEDFAKVFGIAAMSDPTLLNIMYPFSPTAAAKQLGYGDWNYMYQLIEKLKQMSGFDMKASDNNFHVKIPNGAKAVIRRYSQAAVDLLAKVRDGEDLPNLSDAKITGEKPPAVPAG